LAADGSPHLLELTPHLVRRDVGGIEESPGVFDELGEREPTFSIEIDPVGDLAEEVELPLLHQPQSRCPGWESRNSL
jgi:hypothetical protein